MRPAQTEAQTGGPRVRTLAASDGFGSLDAASHRVERRAGWMPDCARAWTRRKAAASRLVPVQGQGEKREP